MRPIRIHAPEGTIVNPVLPAACGARGVVGYRVYDAVMGALAQVTPDRVIAAGDGGPTLIAFGGYEDGRPFVMTEVIVGTWGARAGKDGLEGVSNPLANLSNQPVELVEADLPLEVVRYELVPDSGGAGRFRGGLAYVREFRVLAERAVLTIRSDRRFHPPYGLFGGSAGGASDNVLTTGESVERLPGMPMAATIVRKGDVYRHVSAGGGGVGSPFDRDARSVLEDVRRRKGRHRRGSRALRRRTLDRPALGRRRGHRGPTALARASAARDRVSGGSPTLVIRNGTVLDGTGAEPFRADVALAGGRIERIGEIAPGADASELDATGRYVAPGFIDIHSHSDYTLLVDPRAVSAIASRSDSRGRRQLRARVLPDPRPRTRGARDLRPLRSGTRQLADGGRLLRAARAGTTRRQCPQPRTQRPAAARRDRPRGPACNLRRDRGR